MTCFLCLVSHTYLSSHPSRFLTTLNNPLQLARRPPAIEVPGLRLNLLSIHKAVPRPSIEAHVPFQILKPLRRILIAPYAVLDLFAIQCDGVVGGPAFPLAES
jgi:hypothetical protein